jgi:hypothetical protein
VTGTGKEGFSQPNIVKFPNYAYRTQLWIQ